MENPELRGGVDEKAPGGEGLRLGAPLRDQLAADARERELALQFIRTNLWEMPGYVVVKFARFFGLLSDTGGIWRVAIYALDVALFPVAIAGVVSMWRRRRFHFIPSAAVILATLLAVAIFWGNSRFRSSITPFYIALASVVVADWWDRLGRPVVGRLRGFAESRLS